MPSKYIRLFAVDQVCHGFDPVRALQRFQPSILCILNNLTYITAPERITVKADAVRDLLELAASLAFFGR